jgi:hypothetical protein
MIMADPLPDAELNQIEQRALRALGAAPPSWIPELETRDPIGGCSFVRIGDDPVTDQEMYLEVRTGDGQLTSPDVQLDQIIDIDARAIREVPR